MRHVLVDYARARQLAGAPCAPAKVMAESQGDRAQGFVAVGEQQTIRLTSSPVENTKGGCINIRPELPTTTQARRSVRVQLLGEFVPDSSVSLYRFGPKPFTLLKALLKALSEV
jgi:hypothetical protein